MQRDERAERRERRWATSGRGGRVCRRAGPTLWVTAASLPAGVRSPLRSDNIVPMHARKLRVKNGRLVLDEPTELPEGAEVEVLVIDDELSPEERAELHASLDRALDDSEAGRGMDAWEYLKQYRARREARTA
jgi:hypothetical protein